ncbi:TIGR01212 family radical SAM protein [Lachnobacterium bovis]|uniref:TIGR01212 family radical SAM protein n=1 Tax=Lachnobacterium bovis TaxID=140626 RepID=UPI00048B524F|nr:TIGR01212 family radical SAM protein [Lachnobacterium bovis]
MEYISLSQSLKKIFNTKVYKISLTSGCTCPNRDGKISYGGCTFCSEGGSGDFAAPFVPIDEQIKIAKERVNNKFSSKIAPEDRKYIAYFQSFTNTYGDVDFLSRIYMETIKKDEIVALSLGTRPDCINDKVLEMLKNLNKIKPVWVELGLQTIHETTAQKINRGYKLEVFEEAYRKLKEIGITVIVHVILGLPGESEDDILQTVSYLANISPKLDGIKLQLLHVLKNTKLAREYEENPFKIFTLDEYVDLVIKCLKILPEDIVIHRITGDGPKKLLIAPLWSADKKRVLNTLNNAIRKASREDKNK